MHSDEFYLQRAVVLAANNVAAGGRPFAALLVKDDQMIVEAVNTLHISQDPTAHAELLAIRAASQQLGPRLEGCVIYASGQPCPMCLSAMYLCGVSRQQPARGTLRAVYGSDLSATGAAVERTETGDTTHTPTGHGRDL